MNNEIIDFCLEVSYTVQGLLAFLMFAVLTRWTYVEWRWKRGEEYKDGKWQKDYFHK